MNAHVVRRLTLLLATVVLVLAAREVRAMETARAGSVAGTELVVAGAGSGPAAAAGQCGDPHIELQYCLDWEPCPAPEDLLAFCDAKVEAVCTGYGYLAYDAECHDILMNPEPSLECWLATGDPGWLNCWYVRADTLAN